MRERLQSPTPILFAQFHLLGAARRFGIVAVGYTVALWLFIYLYSFSRPGAPWSVIAGGALYGVGIVQTAIVVLGGLGAVHKALTRDHQTRMIESHRLTPMSSITVVLGYAFGPTLQVTMLAAINLVIGAVLAYAAGAPVKDWVYGNLLVYNGMIALWALSVYFGVGYGKPAASTGAFVAVGMLAQVFIWILPGGGLMLGVYAVMAGVMLMFSSSVLGGSTGLLFVIAASSAALTLFWLPAAAARYRRPDLPALGAARGTVLLLMWLVLSIVGMTAYEIVSARQPRLVQPNLENQWVAVLIASLLVAAIPLGGAVATRQRVARGAPGRGPSDRVPAWLVAGVAPILICVVLGLGGRGIWSTVPHARRVPWGEAEPAAVVTVWAVTFAASLFTMLSFYGLLSIFVESSRGIRAVVVVLVVAALAGPPLLAEALAEFAAQGSRASAVVGPGWLYGLSPVGTIIAAWSIMKVDVVPGLVVQALSACICVALGWTLTAHRLGVLSRARAAARPRGVTLLDPRSAPEPRGVVSLDPGTVPEPSPPPDRADPPRSV